MFCKDGLKVLPLWAVRQVRQDLNSVAEINLGVTQGTRDLAARGKIFVLKLVVIGVTNIDHGLP